MMHPLRFPRCERLSRRSDILLVRTEGRIFKEGALTVRIRPNGLSCARLAVACASRYGGAVERNRFRRLVREAFRLSRATRPGGLDILVSPRGGPPSSLGAISADFARLLGRATSASGR